MTRLRYLCVALLVMSLTSCGSIGGSSKQDLEELKTELKKEIGDLKTDLATNQIAPLRSDLNATITLVNNQQEILRKIAQPIAANDYTLNIRGNLEKPDFQRDFSEAVTTQWTNRMGVVIVRNATPSDQWVAVNARWVNVPSGGEERINVPLGTVITESQHERAKPWNQWVYDESHGQYELRIRLK